MPNFGTYDNPFWDFEQKGGGVRLYGRRSEVIWQEEGGYSIVQGKGPRSIVSGILIFL